MLTVPLAIVQGYAFIKLLQGQSILPPLPFNVFLVDIAVIVAGSMLLMWLGELITEFGVGNGVSLIIFAGIISQLPTAASQFFFTFDLAQLPIDDRAVSVLGRLGNAALATRRTKGFLEQLLIANI